MMSHLRKKKSYLFTFLLTLGMIFAVNIFAAEPTRTLGFQGQFYAENTPGNNPVSATFTFYDSLTDGNITGTPISKIINVVNGYFGTTFTESDTTGVNLNQQLYLEISINGVTLSPRTTVNPTVSSLKSFGTFSYASAPTVGPSGSLYFNTTSQELYVSNGTSWQLSGFASSTTQWVANGTSLNYMAGNVGIGTTTPSTNLEVVGDSYLGAGYPILRLTSKGTSSGGQIQFFQPESTAGTNRKNFGLVFSTYFDTQFQATSTALTFQSRTDTGGFGGTLMSLTSEGRLGLDRAGGSLSPETKFAIGGENATTSQVTLRSFRGAIVATNIIGGINFNSNDSNLTAPGSTTASVQALANQTHTGSALGTDLAFSVTNTTTMSEAMRILGNGNVGIGTSTPLTRLSISASGANGLNLTVDTSNAARSARLFLSNATSGKSGVIMNQSNDIAFNTQGTVGTDSGTERMRITELGNVGIGTTSPVDLFTVATNNVGGVGFTTQGYLSSQAQIRNSAGNGMFFQLLNSIGSSTHMFRSYGDSYLTGNFGVGTTSPNTRLTITSSGANGINLDVDAANATRSARLFFSNATPGQAFAIRNDSNALVFSSTAIVGTDSGTERMRLDSNGNLGIGTTNPSNKLSVGLTTGQTAFFGSQLTLASGNFAGVGFGYGFNNTFQKSAIVQEQTGDANARGTIHILNNNSANSSNATLSDARLSITAAGLVGIGTTAPYSLLSNISVNSTNQGGLGVNGSGFNWGIAGDGYGGAITNFSNNINANGLLVKGLGVASTNKLFTVTASSTDVFTVQGNGNVGINKNNPSQALDIVGEINTTSHITSGFGVWIRGGRLVAGMDSGTNGGTALALYAAGAERLTISATGGMTGNVGIGTSLPSRLLHLNAASGVNTGVLLTDATSGSSSSDGFVMSMDSNYGYLFQQEARGLQLGTNNLTRFTIDTSGNIGIGTTTPGSKLTVAGAINSTDLLGGITTLSVDASGNIIRTPSDQKLKTNVETLTSALDKVNQMRGVSYNWIDTQRFGTSSEIGFIAQELETIVPEVVKSGGEYKSVNYQNLTALLTEAIKELSAKFTNLAKEIKTDKVRTKELCIEKANGTEVCLTGDQVESVLQNQRASAQPPIQTQTPTPTVEEVIPPAPTEEPAPAPAPAPEPAPEII